MQIKVDDYIIVRVGTSHRLAKVYGVDKSGRVNATLEPSHLRQENLQMDADVVAEDVCANLGADPVKGTAFGVDLNMVRFVKTKNHNMVGEVHFFYKPEAAEYQALMGALDDVYETMKAKKVHGMLSTNLSLEVMGGGGKVPSRFKKGSDKVAHRIMMYPHSVVGDRLEYMVHHAFGHMMLATYLRDVAKVRSELLRLFALTSKPVIVERERLVGLFDDMLESGSPPEDYVKALQDDEDRAAMKLGFRTIKQATRFSPRMLNDLFLAGDVDTLREMVATVQGVASNEPTTLLTDLANVSPEALFAECYAFYMAGLTLPKNAKSFIERVMPIGSNAIISTTSK